MAPSALTLALIALPYVDRRPHGSGVWFSRERWLALAIFFVVAFLLLVTTVIGYWFRGPNWEWVWPWTGAIP